MRRVLGGIVIAGLVVSAALLPAPGPEAAPSFTGALAQDVNAAARSSVWYCPWVSSGALRDSAFLIAAAVPVDATVTMPSPIPNEEPDEDVATVPGPGATVVDVGAIVRRGETPGFVELDDGPATVGAMVDAENLLAGDRCVASAPKIWYLPGGTTREGRQFTLRLFNPFPEAAKASVTGVSEFGDAGLGELASLDVPGRSWRDVNLNQIVPLLDDLSLTVTTSEGVVIPTVALSGGDDEATWPGIGPATSWAFPVVNAGGLVPSLVLTNPGSLPAEVEVDVHTAEGTVTDAVVIEVSPDVPRRLTFEDFGSDPFGITVRSSTAVAAAVIAEDVPRLVVDDAGANTGTADDTGGATGDDEADVAGDRIAGTVGASEPAASWLLPGPGSVVGAETSIWLLNGGEETATVTLQPLGDAGPGPSVKVLVDAGTLLEVPVAYDTAVAGYRVESSTPISVQWTAVAARGVAYFAGVAVGE
jgi:hypothetical protein